MGRAEDVIRARHAAEQHALAQQEMEGRHLAAQEAAAREAELRRFADVVEQEAVAALERIAANDYDDGVMLLVAREKSGLFRSGQRFCERAGWRLAEGVCEIKFNTAGTYITRRVTWLLSDGRLATTLEFTGTLPNGMSRPGVNDLGVYDPEMLDFSSNFEADAFAVSEMSSMNDDIIAGLRRLFA